MISKIISVTRVNVSHQLALLVKCCPSLCLWPRISSERSLASLRLLHPVWIPFQQRSPLTTWSLASLRLLHPVWIPFQQRSPLTTWSLASPSLLHPVWIPFQQRSPLTTWTYFWHLFSISPTALCFQVPGLSYNWWGFQAWDTLQDSTDNSSTDKTETSLEWQEYFSVPRCDWCAPLSHPSSCMLVNYGTL